MKYLLYLLTTLFLTAGCGVDDPQADQVKLSADKTRLEFPAEGGEQTITVTSSGQFNLMPGEKWFTAKKSRKEGEHDVIVTVTVEENLAYETRQARLSITAGTDRIYVEVNQAAAEYEDLTDINPKDFETPENTGNLAWQFAERFGIGWNLGNHFDAHNDGVAEETVWGNPKATQATFTKVKEAGFTTVRIPVTWLGHVGEAPEYKIDEEWLNRVAEVVGYAETAGLNAVLNIHHDGADSAHWLDIKTAATDPQVHAQILDQVRAMWTQIAEKFKDKGEFLVFEAFNEVHDGGWGWGDNRKDGGKQYKCLNEWNQAFVDAVRATGGANADRILGIPAYSTNVDLAISSLVMPTDSAKDRLMISVHCYDPHEYTLTAKYSEWGRTANISAKPSGDNEADLKKVFVNIHKNFISKGIPVYLGEFGCVNRETERMQKFQQYYLRYYAKLAKSYGIPCMLWDNGAKGAGNERHAFFDHETGEYCSGGAKMAVTALVDSYNNSQTLLDVYKNAPRY